MGLMGLICIYTYLLYYCINIEYLDSMEQWRLNDG